MKKIIFNYGSMFVGGIETYIYSVAVKLLKAGYQIVWICNSDVPLSPVFEDIFNENKIKFCRRDSNCFWFDCQQLDIHKEDEVVILSWSFGDFIRSFLVKKAFPKSHIRCFYIIPHFCGQDYYPFEIPTSSLKNKICFLKDIIKVFNKRMYVQWINAGCVLYHSADHIFALENKLGIHIAEQYRRLVPCLVDNFDLLEEDIKNRYYNDEFIIVTAGRNEFPHKGFFIGLIRAFVELKHKYQQLRLKVVGFDKNNKMIRDELNKYSSDEIESIEFIPPVSLENLKKLYNNCNLCIAVAGCAYYAGSVGLVTLPARHYSYTCEVYGFFPESKNKTTSCDSGYQVQPFIEQVINMKYEEYRNLSWKIFRSYEKSTVDADYFLTLPNVDEKYLISWFDIFLYKISWHVGKIYSVLRQYTSKIYHLFKKPNS